MNATLTIIGYIFSLTDYYSDFGLILMTTVTISGLWAAFALLSRKDCNKSQAYLAVFMATLAINTGIYGAFDRYWYTNHYETFRMLDALMIIPVIITGYLYYLSLLRPDRLTRKLIFHQFIPYLALILCAVILFLIYGESEGIDSFSDSMAKLSDPNILALLLAYVYVLVYELYTFFTITNLYIRHTKSIKQLYSFDEKISFEWLPVSFTFVVLLWLFNSINNLSNEITTVILFDFIAIAFIFVMYWFGSRQENLSLPFVNERAQKPDENPPAPGRIISKESVLEYFSKKRPFSDPEFTVFDMAKQLTTDKEKINKLFKDELKTDFYSFTNKYRVKHAASILKKAKDMNELDLEEVMIRTGFKSRVSFDKLFKQRYGDVPLRYMQKNVRLNGQNTTKNQYPQGGQL